MMYTLLITRYDVCAALCSDQAPSDEANLYYSFIDEIYPNLYPSMNSAINLLLYTGSGSREVLIEAEITGFSQQYYQMVTVTPEIRFFQIKPPVLPEVPSLSGEKTTQIVLKVTDKETGAILAAESRNVTLRSLYDFSMYNNEFGMLEPYTLLAWLDPESQAILDLRRDAIDWIHTTFGEGYESLPGYQPTHPAEVSQAETTLIQALGIQGAISERGVRYKHGTVFLRREPARAAAVRGAFQPLGHLHRNGAAGGLRAAIGQYERHDYYHAKSRPGGTGDLGRQR